MKTIKFDGKQFAVVQEMKVKDYIFITAVYKTPYCFSILRFTFDGTFGDLRHEITHISEDTLDAVEKYRKNMIDAEEFVERVQLAM